MPTRNPDESFREFLLRKNPSLPVIEAAIEAFKAGKPVTQRCVETGEPLVVEESEKLGFLQVRAGNRVLYRTRRKPYPNAPGPLFVSSERTQPHRL